jgi:hypothetical protein
MVASLNSLITDVSGLVRSFPREGYERFRDPLPFFSLVCRLEAKNGSRIFFAHLEMAHLGRRGAKNYDSVGGNGRVSTPLPSAFWDKLDRNFCDEALRGVGLWPEGGGFGESDLFQ